MYLNTMFERCPYYVVNVSVENLNCLMRSELPSIELSAGMISYVVKENFLTCINIYKIENPDPIMWLVLSNLLCLLAYIQGYITYY